MMKSEDFDKKLKTAMGVSKEKKPYISINKLGEYMQASPARRQAIVKQMKEDKDWSKAYYQAIYSVIPKYIRNGYDSSILENSITDIKKRVVNSDWEKRDRDNSIIALEALIDTEFPDLSDYEFVKDLPKLDKIIVGGVIVGIKPDIYLRNKYSKKIGALKTHVQKTEANQLNENSRQYVATLIKQAFFLEDYKQKDVDSNACISIDVFAKSFSVAPSSYVKRVKDLEASCKEISLWWDAV